MFRKQIKIAVLASVVLTSATNLAVARGGGGGGGDAGGGDHAGAFGIEETHRSADRGRDPVRHTGQDEKSAALGCLQMIVVDPTIANASKDCGYEL